MRAWRKRNPASHQPTTTHNRELTTAVLVGEEGEGGSRSPKANPVGEVVPKEARCAR